MNSFCREDHRRKQPDKTPCKQQAPTSLESLSHCFQEKHDSADWAQEVAREGETAVERSQTFEGPFTCVILLRHLQKEWASLVAQW